MNKYICQKVFWQCKQKFQQHQHQFRHILDLEDLIEPALFLKILYFFSRQVSFWLGTKTFATIPYKPRIAKDGILSNTLEI